MIIQLVHFTGKAMNVETDTVELIRAVEVPALTLLSVGGIGIVVQGDAVAVSTLLRGPGKLPDMNEATTWPENAADVTAAAVAENVAMAATAAEISVDAEKVTGKGKGKK